MADAQRPYFTREAKKENTVLGQERARENQLLLCSTPNYDENENLFPLS